MFFSSNHPSRGFNFNHHEEQGLADHTEINPNLNHLKESMFEKPLTPSDVGKLNRLTSWASVGVSVIRIGTAAKATSLPKGGADTRRGAASASDDGRNTVPGNNTGCGGDAANLLYRPTAFMQGALLKVKVQ
ncbi:hypothetical protein F3Y22_tig00110930pilonHSYRG00026 [Hibiscus syriacus]|uniref:Uncharacterized protein n=1 Tax=Hibiscus syriacus TaxID=106335 RepID=A0A6A2ZG60_HIBSY|nr:hypothetical protein F3Y22_tig00110930pilonHSYRG00026 [Hibiscus syriacus]